MRNGSYQGFGRRGGWELECGWGLENRLKRAENRRLTAEDLELNSESQDATCLSLKGARENAERGVVCSGRCRNIQERSLRRPQTLASAGLPSTSLWRNWDSARGSRWKACRAAFF